MYSHFSSLATTTQRKPKPIADSSEDAIEEVEEVIDVGFVFDYQAQLDQIIGKIPSLAATTRTKLHAVENAQDTSELLLALTETGEAIDEVHKMSKLIDQAQYIKPITQCKTETDKLLNFSKQIISADQPAIFDELTSLVPVEADMDVFSNDDIIEAFNAWSVAAEITNKKADEFTKALQDEEQKQSTFKEKLAPLITAVVNDQTIIDQSTNGLQSTIMEYHELESSVKKHQTKVDETFKTVQAWINDRVEVSVLEYICAVRCYLTQASGFTSLASLNKAKKAEPKKFGDYVIEQTESESTVWENYLTKSHELKLLKAQFIESFQQAWNGMTKDVLVATPFWKAIVNQANNLPVEEAELWRAIDKQSEENGEDSYTRLVRAVSGINFIKYIIEYREKVTERLAQSAASNKGLMTGAFIEAISQNWWNGIYISPWLPQVVDLLIPTYVKIQELHSIVLADIGVDISKSIETKRYAHHVMPDQANACAMVVGILNNSAQNIPATSPVDVLRPAAVFVDPTTHVSKNMAITYKSDEFEACMPLCDYYTTNNTIVLATAVKIIENVLVFLNLLSMRCGLHVKSIYGGNYEETVTPHQETDDSNIPNFDTAAIHVMVKPSAHQQQPHVRLFVSDWASAFEPASVVPNAQPRQVTDTTATFIKMFVDDALRTSCNNFKLLPEHRAVSNFIDLVGTGKFTLAELADHELFKNPINPSLVLVYSDACAVGGEGYTCKPVYDIEEGAEQTAVMETLTESYKDYITSAVSRLYCVVLDGFAKVFVAHPKQD